MKHHAQHGSATPVQALQIVAFQEKLAIQQQQIGAGRGGDGRAGPARPDADQRPFPAEAVEAFDPFHLAGQIDRFARSHRLGQPCPPQFGCIGDDGGRCPAKPFCLLHIAQRRHLAFQPDHQTLRGEGNRGEVGGIVVEGPVGAAVDWSATPSPADNQEQHPGCGQRRLPAGQSPGEQLVQSGQAASGQQCRSQQSRQQKDFRVADLVDQCEEQIGRQHQQQQAPGRPAAGADQAGQPQQAEQAAGPPPLFDPVLEPVEGAVAAAQFVGSKKAAVLGCQDMCPETVPGWQIAAVQIGHPLCEAPGKVAIEQQGGQQGCQPEQPDPLRAQQRWLAPDQVDRQARGQQKCGAVVGQPESCKRQQQSQLAVSSYRRGKVQGKRPQQDQSDQEIV